MTRLSILFDTAIAKLEAQDGKAYDEERDICQYRLNGHSCLFGHMISDENYEENFEGIMGNDDPILEAIEKTTGIYLLDYLSGYEINELQNKHDLFWEPGTDFKSLIPQGIKDKIWGKNVT